MVLPILPFAFLLGPAGLLAYMGLRVIRGRSIAQNQEATT